MRVAACSAAFQKPPCFSAAAVAQGQLESGASGRLYAHVALVHSPAQGTAMPVALGTRQEGSACQAQQLETA